MTRERSCRNCAFCHWREQYCAAKDSDLGPSFMRSPGGCKAHRFEWETEDEETEVQEEMIW